VFLSSLFLVGLGALAIPVIIHLMHSARAEVIRFSCIRFLKNCQRRAARRTRLKQLILMALRMLLLALIVLGMAKPVIQTDKTSASPDDATTAMVLIIDNSYSMGYREEGLTRLDRAKQVALELVDTLKENDEVIAMVMNDGVQALHSQFQKNFEPVKSAIRKITLSSHGTEVSAALSKAYAFLRATEKSRREIHLLTDLQAYSWEKMLETNLIAAEEEPRPRLYISSFGRPNSANAFVDAVSVSGVAAGVGSKILVDVKAVGAGPSDNVLTLMVNGKKREQVAFTVRPDAPAQVPIEVDFDEPGTYRCSAVLSEDSLRIDDSFDFSLTVDDRVTVLLVDGDYSTVPSLSETFFLNAALNPSAYTGMRAGSEIEPTTVSLSELRRTPLDSYKCVIICNAASLDGNDLVKLEAFLNSGGSVVLFLGNRVIPEEYNKWSFVPAQVGEPMGRADKASFFSFGRIAAKHPIFAGMGDLRTAKVFRCFRVKPREGAEVIAELRAGPPVMIERPYGSGRVLMITTSADLEWTNLPLRRAFVPMMHRLVAYMCGRRATSSAYRVGDTVEFRSLAKHYDKTIRVKTPTGRRITLRPQIEGSYAVATFSDTSEPGRYEVRAHQDFSNHDGFSVNPNVLESDLTMIPKETLEREFSGMNVSVLPVPGQVVREVIEKREGWKLWPLLFKLALLFFCLEILVANLFSRMVEYEGVKVPLFDYLKLRRGGLSE